MGWGGGYKNFGNYLGVCKIKFNKFTLNKQTDIFISVSMAMQYSMWKQFKWIIKEYNIIRDT